MSNKQRRISKGETNTEYRMTNAECRSSGLKSRSLAHLPETIHHPDINANRVQSPIQATQSVEISAPSSFDIACSIFIIRLSTQNRISNVEQATPNVEVEDPDRGRNDHSPPAIHHSDIKGDRLSNPEHAARSVELTTTSSFDIACSVFIIRCSLSAPLCLWWTALPPPAPSSPCLRPPRRSRGPQSRPACSLRPSQECRAEAYG